MARVQSPPLFSQLRAARNYTEQAAALRNLRDEIVGHVQQKERWVESGILDSLVQALQSNAPSPSRLNGKESRGYYDPYATLTEDQTVRLLSLQLLASFACGKCPVRPARLDYVVLTKRHRRPLVSGAPSRRWCRAISPILHIPV